MHESALVLFAVVLAVGALLVLAWRTRVPYPILLVLGSVGLGYIPAIPDINVDPAVILLGVLPPLLYSAAFFSSLHDLRDNLRPIGLLSIGLVLLTTVAVGVVAHTVVDGMSWAVAFTLGAIVSPTDPVSATAIASRLGAPRRYVTIIEGEALLNDSTALIAYKGAVAAVVTGSFSLVDAAGQFLLAAAGGIALGLAVGWLLAQVRRRIDDPPTEIAVSLMSPYLSYLPAEALGLSAVLAAVSTGIYLGWHSPELISPSTRIQAYSVWEIVVFVLNSFLFVIVGLQLPSVVEGASNVPTATLATDAAAVCATVIGVRFLWVFPATYVPRMLSARIRARDPAPSWRAVTLIGWTGMRGGVSLAAALAIPFTIDGGGAFPERDLVIFLVYAVILATLLLQGLTLPWLIRWSGQSDGESIGRREAKARRLAAEAAITRLDELMQEDWVRESSARRMRAQYEFRVRRFDAQLDHEDDGELERGSLAYQRLRREVLEAERAEMVRLRGRGFIDDDTMRRIERDLDLEDARLEI